MQIALTGTETGSLYLRTRWIPYLTIIPAGIEYEDARLHVSQRIAGPRRICPALHMTAMG